MELIAYAYELKSTEINLFIILLFFGLKSKGAFFKFTKWIKYLFGYIKYQYLVFTILALIGFNAVSRETPSLFNSIFIGSLTSPLYLTWFDFGERNKNLNFHTENDKRGHDN